MTESSVKISSMILICEIKSLIPHFEGGSVLGLAPEIYVSSLFMAHLSSYDNIFETET